MRIIVACLLLCWSTYLTAQDTITFKNPSFESTPGRSLTPDEWRNAGPEEQSPPDTGPTNAFGSKLSPAHGRSFLHMVARPDASVERVSTDLSSPMVAGQCYQLNLQLARAATYTSVSRMHDAAISFTFPIALRLLGSSHFTNTQELLAQTDVIEHTNWQNHTIQFQPQQSHFQLILEATYAPGTEVPYAGNIAIDNLSALLPITDCQVDTVQLHELAEAPVPSIYNNPSIKDPINYDTLCLLLTDIQPGQVDMALYTLADYHKAVASTPWIICINRRDSKAAKKQYKTLRRRIRALKLEQHLGVRYYLTVHQTLNWLCTPVDLGLGLR